MNAPVKASTVQAAPAPKAGAVRLGRTDDHAEKRADARANAVLAAPAGAGAPPPAGGGPGGQGLPFGDGRPLGAADRAYFEPRFGRSFGQVRLHDGPAAGLAARAVGADAFVLDGGVALAAYPSRRVLAHELSHVADEEAGVLRRDLQADVSVRSLHPSDVAKLGDAELQRLLRFVERLLMPPNKEDPAVLANYGVIRAEWQARNGRRLAAENAAKPAAPQPAAAAGVGTPNVTAPNPLVKAMEVFSSIKPHDQASGLWKGDLDGKTITLNGEQYGQLKARVTTEAHRAIQRASSRAEMAAGRYAEQQKVDAQHWIVAPIVKTLGGVSDPGPALQGYVATANARLKEAQEALAAGDFNRMARLAGQGEAAAEQSSLMVAAYVDQIIGAAEMTVTVLEGIKTAAEITLFLCAVAATGGLAGAGAAALGIEVGATTTVAGITASTATWVTVVGAGAAITQEVALGIMRASDGEKVDWGEIAVHAAIQVIVAKLSPGAGQRINSSLGKAAVRNKAVRDLIARIGMQRVVTVATSLLTHEATQVFSTAVEDTIAAFRGKPITWGQFADHLFERVTDPKGALMALVAGALGGMQPEPAAGKPKPASEGPSPPKSPTDNNDWRSVNKDLGLTKRQDTSAGPSPPKSPTDNNDWRPVNRELGLVKPRTKVTPTPPAPPGYRSPTPEEAFQPTAKERADAFAKEPPGRTPPATTAEEAFQPTPQERAAAEARAAAQPKNQARTTSGEPIRESANASPRGSEFTGARAQTKRSIATGIRADIGESEAYKAALKSGEIGLERPQGTNIGGRDDFITAHRDPSGKMWIIASDAKTRSTATGQFEAPTPGLRKNWDAQVRDAVERVSLGDPKLEAEIKQAYAEKRVWVRQVNVDYAPQGQGSISGVAVPRPTPWGALNPTPDLDRKRVKDESPAAGAADRP
ncbi:MAG: eCIS core domain-containing protein [Inquilinus sp.]|uniref:eCIS core domain-containing protein n=1 Tax=Inquilinus sp. TaxID=1932117 RepID=UPI003F39E52D